MTMLDVGERAPAFELPDLEGRRHSLADEPQQGPTLAVFWKPACGTCDLIFPYLQRLTEAYDASRWQLLAVSQDGPDESAEFVRRLGLTIPVLVEGEGWPVSKQYDPEATPTLFLIGPDGTIEMTSVGFSKEELNEISRRLAEHLGETPQVIAQENDGKPPFRPG
ncbi:MAG: redoxin domain-containing protein [Chloroflexi bacterium]|nr:redoxin domain-containing protein [Chloroflexota bacterium]